MLEIGEHVGTHFDAPIHWITGRDGEDVACVPPARLVGPAVVIDKSAEAAEDPDYLLTVDHVRAFEAEHGALPEGGWLLLRTGWDARAHDEEAFLNAGETARTRRAPTSSARAGSPRSAARRLRRRDGRHRRGRGRRLRPAVPGPHFLLGAGKYGLTQLANLARLPPTGARRRRRAAEARRRDRQPGARVRARAALGLSSRPVGRRRRGRRSGFVAP